jgi:hypothetical protein
MKGCFFPLFLALPVSRDGGTTVSYQRNKNYLVLSTQPWKT